MRLAIIVSHPTQYYGPWFRHIAEAMRQEDESGKVGRLEGGRASVVGQEERRRDQETNRPKDDETSARPDGRGSKLLRAASNSEHSALRVFYLWDFGIAEKTDRGFGKAVKWDVDLLSGYGHEFVPNVSRDPGTHWFGGLDNPELLHRVKAFAPDVVLQFGYNFKSLLNFDLRWRTSGAPLLFRGDSHLLADDGEQGLQLPADSRRRKRIKRWVRNVALRLLFKRFACFLATGKANADYFRAHGVPKRKIVRCPHAVDNEFFRREPEETRGPRDQEIKRPRGAQRCGLRAELGIPDDELVFLFAGKLEEKKQPVQLLEAFRAVDLRGATLLFAGSGALEAELRSRLRGDGWLVKGKDLFEKGAKRVMLLPFQNQSRMPEVYRTGDVLVLPSEGRYETWGLAVNEAACCGLPAIVSSHVGCGPDLIKDGETGWKFEAGKVDALARKLEEAGAGKNRLAEAGARLRDFIAKEFSYDVATDALLRASQKLCHARNFHAGPK